MDYRIFPPEEILEATVALPQSKSMAMRAIALQWLIDGTVPEALLPLCADTAVFGKNLAEYSNDIFTEFDCAASGAALRFMIALMSARPGASCAIGGDARLNKRPIKPLVDALRSMGAEIEYLGTEGFAPVKIYGCRLKGGNVEVDASVSSQLISALMLISPALTGGLKSSSTAQSSLPPISR